jgi:phasin family protein
MSDDPAARMQKTATQATENATQLGRSAVDMGMAKMAEYSKMFADMKMPMMPGMPDMDSFLALHRKNLEVLTAANKVALEGAQTVARRHMEIMQETMHEISETMRDMTTAESPQAKAAKQTEMMKASYERAVSHVKELADLIQRSNGEALNMLHGRFTEAMDEVKAIAAKSAKSST